MKRKNINILFCILISLCFCSCKTYKIHKLHQNDRQTYYEKYCKNGYVSPSDIVTGQHNGTFNLISALFCTLLFLSIFTYQKELSTGNKHGFKYFFILFLLLLLFLG